MKTAIAVRLRLPAVLLSLTVALLASSAVGQEAGRWVDPTQTWSLDLTNNRWGAAEAPIADVVLIAAPAEAPADHEFRLCLVAQEAQPRGEADNGEIRGRSTQMDERAIRAAFPRAALRQIRITRDVINDVSVASIEAISQDNRFRGRVFFTPTAGGAVLSTISCISTPGMPAARDAEVDAVLASLRFAAAPSAVSWTDPSGRFTLSYAELGWSGPPPPADAGNYLLAVANPDLQAGGAGHRICAVRYAPPARMPADTPRRVVDQFTLGLNERQLQRFHHTDAPVQNLRFIRVDGVPVADYVTETNGAWQRWRTFWLLQGDQIFMYDVACTATPPVSAAEMENMAAFLDSLRFTSTDPK